MSEETLKKLEEKAHMFALMSRDEDDPNNLFYLGYWAGITTTVRTISKEHVDKLSGIGWPDFLDYPLEYQSDEDLKKLLTERGIIV